MNHKKEDHKIPVHTPTFEEISKQMRINIDILKEEITDHINKEIDRMKKECKAWNDRK